MPLKHSPPRPPLNKNSKSDTDLNCPSASTLTVPISKDLAKSDPSTIRKRKRSVDNQLTRDDVLDIFLELKKEQDEKLSSLFKEQNDKYTALMNKIDSGITTHTEQNVSISSAIDFLSQKYDDMTLKINKLEEERHEYRSYIKTLEARIDQLERSQRSSSLEIRNVPKKTGESKHDLINIVRSVGTALNINMVPADIRDVYRVNTKNEKSQIIVADLSTVTLRESVVSTLKAYNKKYSSNKFNTTNLRLDGPARPVFVSENLTLKAKRIFYLAREFAKVNDFKYCWTTKGQIYMRKTDGSALIRIHNEEDLGKIKQQ